MNRADRLLFRILVAVTVAPIGIAAVRNGIAGWYPARDTAITAIHANDVLAGHPPLIGLPAFPSSASAIDYNLIGAPMTYLLAVPVRLFGNAWGLLATTAVMNTAWVVVALWLLRRRVGYRAAIAACVFGATLLWGIGSQVLVDPTPVQSGVVASLTLLIATWSVAEGDPRAFVPLAAAASFTVLDHLQFLVVAPLSVAFALVVWRRRTRAADRARPDGTTPEPTVHRRTLAASALVTLVLWLPSLIDQISGSGNLSSLLRAVTSPAGARAEPPGLRRGPLDAIGIVSSPLTQWPLWFRRSFADPHFWLYGPETSFLLGALGLAVTVVAIGFVWVTASRRGDRSLVTALGAVVVTWFGWLVSGLTSATAQGWKLKYFHPLWPVAMVLWFVLALGMFRWARARTRWPRLPSALDPGGTTARAAGAAAVLAVGTFSALNVPFADLGSGTIPRDIPVARRIHEQVTDRIVDGGPVIARSAPASRPYLPVALAGLQERGVEFRLESDWDVRVYGSHRAVRPDEPDVDRVLTVDMVPGFARGDHLIASAGPALHESADTYFTTGQRLGNWLDSVTSLPVHEGADLPEHTRRTAVAYLDGRLARSSGAHRSLLDDPGFVSVFQVVAAAHAIDFTSVDGLDDAAVTAWAADQRSVLAHRDTTDAFVFVTIGPLRP